MRGCLPVVRIMRAPEDRREDVVGVISIVSNHTGEGFATWGVIGFIPLRLGGHAGSCGDHYGSLWFVTSYQHPLIGMCAPGCFGPPLVSY